VHAGQLGPERAAGREQGADASDLPALCIQRKGVWSNQFKLHDYPALSYGNIMPYAFPKRQPKAAPGWGGLTRGKKG